MGILSIYIHSEYTPSESYPTVNFHLLRIAMQTKPSSIYLHSKVRVRVQDKRSNISKIFQNSIAAEFEETILGDEIVVID